MGGSGKTAVEAFRAAYRLEELRAIAASVWQDIDVLVLPTSGTIYRIADVLADPHLTDVGFFEERESPDLGKYRSMKHPVLYAGTPVSNYAHPPMLDADGDEIKAALGM